MKRTTLLFPLIKSIINLGTKPSYKLIHLMPSILTTNERKLGVQEILEVVDIFITSDHGVGFMGTHMSKLIKL